MFKAEQKSEKAPGYRGDIMLGGVVWEIAAWVKEGKNGKFFSLSGKQKGETYKNGLRQEAPREEFDDGSIPF